MVGGVHDQGLEALLSLAFLPAGCGLRESQISLHFLSHPRRENITCPRFHLSMQFYHLALCSMFLTFQHSFLPTGTNSWKYIMLVLKWKSECLVTEPAAREEKNVACSSKLQKTGTTMHHKTGH